MTISPTEAAFEGFRVARRSPGAILAWAGVWLVGLILMMVVAMPFMMPWVEEIVAAKGDASALPAGARSALQYAVFASVPVIVLMQGLLTPAVYREVLRPTDKGFAWLRIGGDELRLLAVMIGLGAVSLAFNFGSLKLEELAEAGALALPLRLLLSLALFALSIFVTVRLSLVAPLTFIHRRFAFSEGLRMSGRMFWPLLGMTVIVIVMALVVGLLLYLIALPLQIIGASASGAAVVGSLLLLLLLPLGMTLVTVVLWAPFAALCRDEAAPAIRQTG